LYSAAVLREATLQLRPASELERRDADWWVAPHGPIRFELDPGGEAFPHGWVLLRGRLSRTILDGSAKLIAHTDSAQLALDVPISIAGFVYELVELPPAIRRLVWQPSLLAGTFEHTPLTMRRIGPLRRRWLMTRRVAAYAWREAKETKRRAGLRWWRSWEDLEGQYRACGKLRSYIHSLPYDEWIARFDAGLTERDRRRIRSRITKLRVAPHFSIVVHGVGEALTRTVRSLDAQLYRNYSVIAADAAIDPATYACVLRAGDCLAEHALYWAAEAIAGGQNVAMLYADEDEIDAHGVRSKPRFKPDWSPEHLRSINYVGRWAVFRATELASAGGLRPESLAGSGHELNLRVADVLRGAKVAHIPAVLYHRAATRPDEPAPRVRRAISGGSPLVSIIIPTRDREAMLRNCIDSIERATRYRNYEILVIDNRSIAPDALAYLASLKHRVLRYEHDFNYSAINNLAVQAARGEAIVLLNNDTEVISPDWLEEMLGHLHQNGVGVVGAKLLYGDGRVQHAGVAVGPGGCADHMHLGLERDAPGYCYRAVVAQEVSAVTGACLMTWKSLYQRLGGLDEKELAVSFNDVDYCLRVLEAGQRVIFTPHAQLYHLESASRGRGRSDEQQARETREANVMRRRWRARLQHDPYYNPNLSYRYPDFSLSDAPRAKKPWLR
jgi:O-antigen biosynthesis protein